MIEMFEYMNKKLITWNCCHITQLKECRKKGHSMKLKGKKFNGQRRANFFGLRVVNAWNQQPYKL